MSVFAISTRIFVGVRISVRGILRVGSRIEVRIKGRDSFCG